MIGFREAALMPVERRAVERSSLKWPGLVS
jgi:hypothetical protein